MRAEYRFHDSLDSDIKGGMEMAMDSSGVEIKVQPDVLNAKASDVSTSISQMEQLFDTVQTTVARTKYYWIGGGRGASPENV